MPLCKTIDYVNGFMITKELAHHQTHYYVYEADDDYGAKDDMAWQFDTLWEAVQFCESKHLCLLIIAPEGDDGPKDFSLYDEEDKALEKIEEKYTIPDTFYDCGVMRIGDKGYIAMCAYDWGDPIGDKPASYYLKRLEK